jgi:hypothetical protein
MSKAFYKIYNTEVEKCIPKIKYVKRKVGNKPIWMNREGLKKVRKKHNSWHRYLNTKDGEAYLEYIRHRNEARSFTRKLVKNFESEIAKNIKLNPKRFWKYVNSKTKTKIGIESLKDENGRDIQGDKEKAELLNSFFISVFTREDIDNPPHVFPLNKLGNIFEINEITKEIIDKKISKLKITKSPGPDNCHPKIIKELKLELLTPLFIIFNKSIETGCVPNDWKLGNITALHKKGSRALPQNYRPVSLTSILGKMLESCIKDQMLNFIKENNIFTDDQHGFLPHRSCITQLLIVMEEWSNWIDEGSMFDTIYLDFSKAFDSVPHQRLLLKLKTLGMGETLINWVRSFISNRKQRVMLNGKFSKWESVTSGVPQGSVLGPVLFLMYINDLPDAISQCTKIFADDTKIYGKIENNDSCNLQNDINNASTWSQIWQLHFNSKKCKVIHYGKKNINKPYDIYNPCTHNNENLSVETEEKDLGILFTNDLNFDKHITQCINKANRMMGIVKRNFEFLDANIFIPLYKSLVRSHLEYGNCIWKPYKRIQINKLEKVQRRATKCVNSISHLPYADRLKILKLPTLEYRRQRGDMIQVYKIIHGIDNLNPDIFFKKSNNNLRGHTHKLFKPRVNSDLRKFSFSVRVVDTWNNLPDELVTADSLNSFKNRLDNLWKNKMYEY